MIPQEDLYFYKEASAVEDPIREFHNVTAETASVCVEGNFSGVSFTFEGKTDLTDEAWYPISGIRQEDLEVKNTFSTSGIYNVPIEGLQRFRVKLKEISDGNITIFARIMRS